MGNAAILRWTGRGRIEDLETSLSGVLRIERMRAKVRRAGGSFVLEHDDPVGIATLFHHLPGVSWAAVGRVADSIGSAAKIAGGLAPAYLGPGETFSVSAESGEKEATPSDVSGAITSAILEAVKGARVDEERPGVRFRAAFEGGRCAVGVQLWEGPGGAPTGKKTVQCLVSGGMHSSVVAWHALVSGFGVKLVHAMVDEESLREVARLYSELSNRVDPSGLSLEVIEGGNASTALRRAVKHGGDVYGGFHSGCGEVPGSLSGKVEAPLYLLGEEEFVRIFSGLSLKGRSAKERWNRTGRGPVTSRTFGHERADMHRVLDELT